VRITEEHHRRWNEDGYVLVEGVLGPQELEAIRAEADRYFPTADEYFHAPRRYEGLNAHRVFPYAGLAINDATLHQELVSFAERAIGTPELTLSHGSLWAKYSGGNEHDQLLHVDFGNNTLAYPRDDGEFCQVTMIIYVTDVGEEHGPTYAVPRRFTRELELRPGVLSREQHPDLYDHEVPVTGPAGSALIYRTDVIHRGSALRGDKVWRLSMNNGFRRAGFEWMGHSHNFAAHGQDPEFTTWFEQASPRQRQLLGFPAPGHSYWNQATLAGVARRYPHMDLGPYRDAHA
jgi:hypothetical protein